MLSRLPSDTVIRGLDSPLVDLLASEITRDAPGQAAALDRLLDLLVVTSLREVFSSSTDHAPARFVARQDPVASRTIQLMHHHPAHPWSVATLADTCGVSRATLARRFNEFLGEPPMSFLTSWRLAIAADLLADPNFTLGSVVTRFGYANAFALSAAFKRVHGVAPTEYRRQAILGAEPARGGSLGRPRGPRPADLDALRQDDLETVREALRPGGRPTRRTRRPG